MDNRYCECGYGSIVNAVYEKPICPIDENNKFIEAIPHPLMDDTEIMRYYTRSVPSFDSYLNDSVSNNQKRIMLSQLKNLRMFLPFQKDLEIEFYNSLVSSYRNRKQVVDSKTGAYKLISNTGKGTNAGFTLLGYSGCGKSSTIDILTSHYPQCIVHQTDRGEITQILYLTVSCLPNSNFKALYTAIGKAIDQALGTYAYEPMLEKIKHLGPAQQKIVSLIELFNIGIIIFDEIQLIDFDSQKEASFESLMTISNQTKVAMAVIGTEDGYQKMFTKLRTSRRLGRTIPASVYCQNKKYINFLLSKLCQYQLINKPIKMNDGILEAFYQETHGIVDQLVSLFISIQDECLSTAYNEEIDARYIIKVSKKRYPELRKLIKVLDSPEKEKEFHQMLKDAKMAYENSVEELKQKESMETAISNQKNNDVSEIVKVVINSIKMVTNEFDELQIEQKTYEVIGNVDKSLLTADDITKQVFTELNKKITKTRKPKQKSVPLISKQDMLDSILKQ